MKKILFILLFITIGISGASAQSLLSPEEEPGEVYYIPFPVTIQVDGELNDWDGVPTSIVDRGPLPSEDNQNGPLTFAVAADEENLYITMTISDQNIITGQHGEDYWNEDSLEFYFNLTDNINTTAYGLGIFQMRIIPADIGNSDPAALTVSGVFNDEATLNGFVFETEDGWGFEASFPLNERIMPEHGLNVGFQAQANGASSADRDLKLIWSNADTDDNSWQNPSLFGTAVFYEIGRNDIPATVDRESVVAPPPAREERPDLINLNQLGYFPDAPKIAAFHHESESPLAWVLKDENNNEISKGQTVILPPDTLTGSNIHQIDFTALNTIGRDYKLEISDLVSVNFDIDNNIYTELKREALAFFYRSRSGIELLPEYAGEQYARAAGHLSDASVTCFQGKDIQEKEWPGCDYVLDAAGGWYDAGDYGKYVVNGGISVWTLMNSYERNPSAWGDGTLNIPENKNSVPDILDEARWEMEFLLAMQVPSGEKAGMVHHKLHGVQWDGLPILPETEQDNDLEHQDPTKGRYLMPPTTAATLNVAATAAQCARIWANIDAEFANKCLESAETAWQAALEHPNIYAGSVPGTGGGDYGDANVADEFYWAAAELYITTGEQQYFSYLAESPNYLNNTAMYWGDTGALGTISLALVPNNLPHEAVIDARASLARAANDFSAMMDANAYQIPVSEFVWGSNSNVLNNLIIMGLAYEFTGQDKYLDNVTSGLDYLLGRNPAGISYVTGFGEYAAKHPHHRFWANTADGAFPPPPPGALVGGPNAKIEDPVAEAENLIELPPAQRYIDDIESYATNEVAINWNAPLSWVASFVDDHKNGRFSERPEPKITSDNVIKAIDREPIRPDLLSAEASSSISSRIYIIVFAVVLGVLLLLTLLFVYMRKFR